MCPFELETIYVFDWRTREGLKMDWVSSPWKDDTVELSWWDLVLLALGRTLKDGPMLIARRGCLKVPSKAGSDQEL
jgi:hypothetical protein